MNTSGNYYYPIEPLEEVALKNDIPIDYVNNTGPWNIDSSDLIICSTFHRILRLEHIRSAQHIVNIHPSLLPNYKGATPTNWQIYDDIQITGVSAHLITSEEVDSGPIIAQKEIFNPSLSDWQLRMTLAKLTEFLIDDIIENFPKYTTIKGASYSEGLSALSSKKARTEGDATYSLDQIESLRHLNCLIRAFDNYPNLRIKINERTFMVNYSNFTDLAEVKIDGNQVKLPGEWIV
ncbi:formyltransferase family protein [Synechococcus sp. AH-736-M20]|nr:formyltransferase family protein [Synechococcus sp. AH-736-M20]